MTSTGDHSQAYLKRRRLDDDEESVVELVADPSPTRPRRGSPIVARYHESFAGDGDLTLVSANGVGFKLFRYHILAHRYVACKISAHRKLPLHDSRSSNVLAHALSLSDVTFHTFEDAELESDTAIATLLDVIVHDRLPTIDLDGLRHARLALLVADKYDFAMAKRLLTAHLRDYLELGGRSRMALLRTAAMVGDINLSASVIERFRNRPVRSPPSGSKTAALPALQRRLPDSRTLDVVRWSLKEIDGFPTKFILALLRAGRAGSVSTDAYNVEIVADEFRHLMTE